MEGMIREVQARVMGLDGGSQGSDPSGFWDPSSLSLLWKARRDTALTHDESAEGYWSEISRRVGRKHINAEECERRCREGMGDGGRNGWGLTWRGC